jgi:2-furoyl-CoA dehydrogenase large subunit
MTRVAASWCGQSVERVEDGPLLTGRGRFIDDLGVRPDTLHAAILRSPHAHAKIRAADVEAARKAPGVAAVITGVEVTALSASLVAGVKAPIECWPIAVERVRYTGEPVAVVVAADRYLAEDALELIEVDYDPLPALVDPLAATRVIRARVLTAIPAHIADVRKPGHARAGKSENGARERGAVLHVLPHAYLAMLTYFPLTTMRIAVMPVPSRTASMVIGPATPGKSLSVPRH